MKPDVSIIYIYYNTDKELISSLKTIYLAVGDLTFEVIIVDNNSSTKFIIPESLPFARKIKILKNKINLGYGAGINSGVELAKGKVFLFSNPDTFYSPFSIKKLHDQLKEDGKIGAIGPMMLNTRNEIQQTVSGNPLFPNGIFALSFLNKLFPNNRFSKSYWMKGRDLTKTHFVETIGGACMMVSRVAFEKVHGFDERFFLFFEETDFCLRLRKKGYKLKYCPDAIIQHLGSRSMKNNTFVKKKYEESRFKFFSKYHGWAKALLAELLFRFANPEYAILFGILIISVFLNLYKIDPLTLFIGDFGKDYLAARDMLLTGNIPLVGIKSSVVWLHQGPLSVYLIGLAFFISKFNPYAPAVLYSILGVFATYLVYMLGKSIFNNKIGIFSALFYATSPLIIVSTRMPYHSSPIPLVTLLFFIILYKVLKGKKSLLFLLFFIFGILLQLELSNTVLFVLLIILFLLKKPKIIKKDTVRLLSGLLIGVSPFLLYDITHRFVYSIGFPLWVVNRIRLFFTLHGAGQPFQEKVGGAIQRIYQQGASAIFPDSQIVAISIVILVLVSVILSTSLLRKFKTNNGLLLISLWLIIPLLGFSIHATPGTAYFPLLFPALSLLIGYSVFYLTSRIKALLLLFAVMCLYNAFTTVNNEYYLFTKNKAHALPPEPYSYGFSMDIPQSMVHFIVQDAAGKSFSIMGESRTFQLENFEYLIWYEGGRINPNSKLVYKIYINKTKLPLTEKIIYSSKYLFVTKHEK